MIKRILLALTAAACLLSLSGCIAAAVGAGAAVGYGAHKEGYRLQSPVKKD